MFLKYFIILLKKFHKGFKRDIFCLFFMSVFAGFLELAGIAMIFPVMLLLTSPDTKGSRIIIDFFAEFYPNIPQIKIAAVLSILMIVIFIFKNIFMIYFIKFQNHFVKRWSDYVNSILVKKLFFAPYAAIRNLEQGDKFMLLNSSVREISLNYILRIIVMMANGIVALCILALLFYKFTIPAFLSTGFILIYAYFENSYFKKKARELGKKNIELSSKLGVDVNFAINSAKEIIISNKRKQFSNYLISAYNEISENFSKEVFFGSCPLYVTEIGVILSFLIMMGTIFLMTDVTKTAVVSSVAVIALMVLRLVPQLNKVLISMYSINITKPKVVWFLDKLNKIWEFEFDNSIEKEKIDFKEKIKFENVSFSYDSNKGIYDINLEIKKGEFIGIIGLSGSGKTTFADILAGVYTPEHGSIFIDNKRITKDNIVSFQKRISFLQQEAAFLPGNVLKNIIWEEEENNENISKAKKALKKAELDIDIYSDMNLSIGQKKRVALARAYYKDFDILILDEATSSLDVEIENQVTKNIEKLKGEKTIIAIAHRLNTLKTCDKIVYFLNGRIEGVGSFEELRKTMPKINEMLKISSFD